MSDDYSDAMLNWAETQLQEIKVGTDILEAVKKIVPPLIKFKKELTETNILEALKRALPEQEKLYAVSKFVASCLEKFVVLEGMRGSKFYENARLSKDLLKDENLNDYIRAAEKGADIAIPFLDWLTSLQEQDTISKETKLPNVYASIIASSGTGKTQLAATAGLKYAEKATVIYLHCGNFDPRATTEGTQRFYRPHISRGSLTFQDELSSFLEQVRSPRKTVVPTTSATIIRDWAEQPREDDGTVVFVHILYHLLMGKRADVFTKLSDLKNKVQAAEKKFLVFLDEVPHQRDTETTIPFNAAACLRDTFRYLGIAPVLMSTHTGAQQYIAQTARTSSDTLMYALSRLPSYAPFPTDPRDCFVASERPLVLRLALEDEKAPLLDIVKKIRMSMQDSKAQAWRESPALQLAQFFCTDIDIRQNGFNVSHKLIGHHFGCLDQNFSSGDSRSQLGWEAYSFAEANLFGNTLRVAPVSAKYEPLLYLALVTWDESMLESESKPWFPLVESTGEALTVRGAFNMCSKVFVPSASSANAEAVKADGDLMEVLVHASFTLASLKTDNGEKFLPGMPMQQFLTLVRHLMVRDRLIKMPEPPDFFNKIKFGWPVVPALGGSNARLPEGLAKATDSCLGYLARPADKLQVDGLISYIDSSGVIGNPFMSIECKNYTEGVNATVLKEAFTRIPAEIECACIFVSSFLGDVFSQTNLTTLKAACFSKRNAGAISVVVWEKDKDPNFLKVSGEEFRACDATELLVVVFTVGLVSVNGSDKEWDCRRKRKPVSPPCANLPVDSSTGSHE